MPCRMDLWIYGMCSSKIFTPFVRHPGGIHQTMPFDLSENSLPPPHSSGLEWHVPYEIYE